MKRNRLNKSTRSRGRRSQNSFAKHPKTILALSVSAVLSGTCAMAQEEEPVLLDIMRIEERTIDTNPYAEPGAPYKAKKSGDVRHVKPLADTPQTIEVLTQTRIEESGKSDMRDVLATLPGITLGTGENGNAFGDRYVIRGHETRSDVFIDGMRDPGMTTRESFAAEQIEVTKGPSSTFAGRGSTGGAINVITKKASTEYDFTSLDAGLGTDEYIRLAIDSNQRINDQFAVRANLMYSYKEIPDRDPADEDRIGALISGLYAPSDRLKLVADYYYLKAEDIPDLGTYFVDGKPEDDPPVYLQEDRDFLDTEVGAFTLKASYEFNDNFRLENGFRYGETDNGYVNSNGRQSGTSSAHNGWQNADYLGNQANFFYNTKFAETEHTFVFGVEYTEENVENGLYNVTTNPSPYLVNEGPFGPTLDYGQAIADGVDPSKIWSGEISKGDADSDFDIETISYYLMDTFDLTNNLTVFAGVRYDDFDYSNSVRRFQRQTNADGTTNFVLGDPPVKYSYSDGFWNYHGSLVYHFLDDANVYFTYSTATNINGGESDVGSSCGYGGICGDPDTIGQGEPEETENLELGVKWEFFNKKLLATLAVFEITKDDVMESNSASAYETTGTYNTGENRIEGVEFSLTGNFSEKLSMQFGAAIMSSEVLDSYLDGTVEVTSRGGAVSMPDNIGKGLANVADESANLQLRYQFTPAFSAGIAATYKGEMYVGQPDTAAAIRTNPDGSYEYSYKIPDYTSFDLFANYRINQAMNLRLNANNITDEDIYTAAYRSGQFVYIGERRNAYLTLTYDF